MKIAPVTVCVFGILLSALPPLVRAEALDDARVKQIASWMEPGTYSPTPNVDDREFWRKVGQSRLYKEIVKASKGHLDPPLFKE
jgi:hypothetical protein